MLRIGRLLILTFWVASRCGASSSSGATTRDVSSLSTWAAEQGIKMHSSLQWKHYGGTNWGFELKESVPKGTLLMQVPRDLVLESGPIYEEFQSSGDYTEKQLKQAIEKLGTFVNHKENFWIVCKLRRCCKAAHTDSPENKWAPWIDALPKSFPEFTQAERECLPFYAKYATDYLEQKFDAFCQAAAELNICQLDDKEDIRQFKWAFQAVGSRFWTTQPNNPTDVPVTELCPVGDMYNHREPSNVKVNSHEHGAIDFVYKGADEKYPDNKDLFITYGQPSNPHRFLAIFGFVPEDMPYVWSHLTYPDNPFTDNVPHMVFRTHDGAIPKIVWDAVLHALLEPPASDTPPSYSVEQHTKYRKHTLGVLMNHVQKQLDELTSLRNTKIDAAPNSPNMDLIRQHNAFLTTVFSKVLARLQSGNPDEMMVVEDDEFRVE